MHSLYALACKPMCVFCVFVIPKPYRVYVPSNSKSIDLFIRHEPTSNRFEIFRSFFRILMTELVRCKRQLSELLRNEYRNWRKIEKLQLKTCRPTKWSTAKQKSVSDRVENHSMQFSTNKIQCTDAQIETKVFISFAQIFNLHMIC